MARQAGSTVATSDTDSSGMKQLRMEGRGRRGEEGRATSYCTMLLYPITKLTNLQLGHRHLKSSDQIKRIFQ